MWNSPLKKGDRIKIPGDVAIKVSREPDVIPELGLYGLHIVPISGTKKALASYGFKLGVEVVVMHRAPFRFKSTPILAINDEEAETLESEFFSRTGTG